VRFHGRSHIDAQFLGSLQCSLDAHEFQLTGGDLAGRFVVNPGSLKTALMTGKHTSEKWSAITWLRRPLEDLSYKGVAR